MAARSYSSCAARAGHTKTNTAARERRSEARDMRLAFHLSMLAFLPHLTSPPERSRGKAQGDPSGQRVQRTSPAAARSVTRRSGTSLLRRSGLRSLNRRRSRVPVDIGGWTQILRNRPSNRRQLRVELTLPLPIAFNPERVAALQLPALVFRVVFENQE